MINLEQFKKLQILEISTNSNKICDIIPYFASKFTPDHFKLIQIKMITKNFYKEIVMENSESLN